MSSFYTSTIKVNDVPMDPAAVATQIRASFSAFQAGIGRYATSLSRATLSPRISWSPVPDRGAFQGIEPTGRRVTISDFTFYRLEDGKFAEVWDLADMDVVIRQIAP